MKPQQRYQIDTSQVVQLLHKAGGSAKNHKLDAINSVRNTSSTTKFKQEPNLFTKEFLKLQLSKEPHQNKQKSLSSTELAMAMQKYHQLLQQKKEPRSTSKGQAVLSQLVTKVSPNMELNLFKKETKPPTPTESKSHRPSTSESKALLSTFQHKRQQSNGAKDQIFKKLQIALMPKAQSQQVTPVSTVDRKFFEAQRKKSETSFPYYVHKIKQAFTKPTTDDYFSRLYRDHFFQTYQGVYVASFLKPTDPNDLKTKCVQLKRHAHNKDKITIIFDLDETLVHCNENLAMPADVVLSIQINANEQIKAGINIRPGAIQLLESLVNDFELIVFTASHSCYAQKVIDYLDPTGRLISHRLFRDNCIMTTGGMYTKDLRIFDRSMSQMVLVDNAAYSYAWQIDNGIPIIPFYDNKEDRELESLRRYLRGMIGIKDVREYNKHHLKLMSFHDNQGPAAVFEKLFNQKMEI